MWITFYKTQLQCQRLAEGNFAKDNRMACLNHMLKSVANHEDPTEVLMAFQENTILHNDKYRKCDKNHIKDTYCVTYGGWQEHFTAIDSLEIQFTT